MKNLCTPYALLLALIVAGCATAKMAKNTPAGE